MPVLRDYFWPNPPRRISAESQDAMKADLEEKGLLSMPLEEKHRSAVNVWTRHSDNLARAENREWMRVHGAKFVRRWAVVAVMGWIGALAVSGTLWLEVPLVLLGVVAVVHGVFFQYLRHMEAS